MRLQVPIIKGDKIIVDAPPWRKDIVHWVDLSEDIAIAADYNDFVPIDPQGNPAGQDPKEAEEEMMKDYKEFDDNHI